MCLEQCRNPTHLLLVMRVGGRFQLINGRTQYVGGDICMREGVSLNDLNIGTIRGFVMIAQKKIGCRATYTFNLWYKQPGKELTNGRLKLESECDIQGFYQSRDMHA